MVSMLRFTLAECTPQGVLPDDISMDSARRLKARVEVRDVREKAQADRIKAAKLQAALDQVDNPDLQLPEPKPKKPRKRKSRYMAVL